VIDETRLLFHRLRAAADQVHGHGEISAGLRGVLRDLSRFGPQTVPQMARRRPVSRQHIQVLVDRLAEDGHVELNPNPAHKRSRLVCLTARGESFVATMNRREEKILGGLKISVKEKDLRTAAQVLRKLRESLEGEHWERLAKAGRRLTVIRRGS
jgi:DNA-binding MarR family transcriptional regulator